jgi:hypothetical protein
MSSANEKNGKPPGMDEAQLLAPWFVIGKLDDAEAREVEALAKEDQEFANLIAEALRESEADVFVNEALGGPPPGVWQRIEKSIGQEKHAQSSLRQTARIQSLKDAISGFFSELTVPQWQAVSAAAVAICVIQAGALIYLSGAGQPGPNFHTASGPRTETGARNPAFIVSFSDKASIGDISKALEEAGVDIVEGPNTDMLYHLGLRNDNIKAKDLAYAKLQSSGVVKLILPEK